MICCQFFGCKSDLPPTFFLWNFFLSPKIKTVFRKLLLVFFSFFLFFHLPPKAWFAAGFSIFGKSLKALCKLVIELRNESLLLVSAAWRNRSPVAFGQALVACTCPAQIHHTAQHNSFTFAEGWLLTMVSTLGLLPAARSNCTDSLWPYLAAQCSGVPLYCTNSYHTAQHHTIPTHLQSAGYSQCFPR